jgi:cyanate lyase
MVTKCYVGVNSLSSSQRTELRGAVKEISDSMLRANSERDLQAESVSAIAEKLGVDKKVVRRMAKAHFKENFNNLVDADHTFEEFYSVVMTPSGGTP